MGHKRIGNKQIKQMMNELLPLDNQAEKNNALLVDEKDSKKAKKSKLQLDEAQK